MTDIPLHWLDGSPARTCGVTFGVPFARGQVALDAAFHLVNAAGREIPTQCRPLARWPDGSLKWLGCAAVFGPDDGALALRPGPGPAPATPVTVQQLGIEIFRQVKTGAITVDVGDRGTALIQQIVRHGERPATVATGAAGSHAGGLDRTVAGAMHLIVELEHRSADGPGVEIRRRESGHGLIKQITVEQSGPVRAVIRLDGVHRMDASRREWLPFTVRLAFWAGLECIDVAHTMVFDGDAGRDFIAGLGLRWHVPLLDTPDNRHVRFAGAAEVDGESDGPVPIWCEPARYPHLSSTPARQTDQVMAQRVEPRGEDVLLPAWDGFRLEQDSADHFAIRKRQGGPVCWIDCGHGQRAAGLAALSDPGGGLAVGVEDFWESFPGALAADGVTGTESTLTAWLWSDRAEPMDLRHYGTRDHRPVYEAVNPDPAVFSSAQGIARTSRLRLWALEPGASHERLAACAGVVRRPPLPVCEPQRYAATRVFGPLSAADRSTPARAAVEDELAGQFDFFKGQIEARRWYGFWNHGDVMHSYDHIRHVWRYDIGGCAWHNAELAADLWLWYAFIRSGRADAFRLAAAMTRHVGEVDSFHLGVWKGQGSRHNVVHWGCPCKEPRVCVAQPKRFLYYLTADERTGDLLDEVALSHLGRATNVPTEADRWEARIGPTWATFASNWLAAWERSGDPRWRDLITRGIAGILASPHGLLTGTPFTFDPATGAMTFAGDHSYAANRLVSVFGGAEAWMELAGLLDDPAFADAVADYGAVHALPPAGFAQLPESLRKTISLRWSVAKLAAFAAVRRNDAALARRTWELLFDGDGFAIPGDALSPRTGIRHAPEPLRGGTVEECDLTTVHDSQWALNTIAAMSLVPEALDRWWQERRARR